MSPYLWVMRKRLPVILLTTMSALFIAYVLSARSANSYTATTQILMTPFGIERPDNASTLYFEQAANTFSTMLHGEAVTSEAKKRLNVATLPLFSLQPVANTELLELRVTDETAESAEETANVLANTLVDTIRARYNVNAKNVEKSIEQQLEEREKTINGLVRDRIEAVRNRVGNGRVSQLDRLISVHESAYDELMQSRNRASVAAATQANLVSVYQLATASGGGANSRLPVALLAGAIAGFLGGLALAFIIEGRQRKLYTPKQVEAVLGKEILGSLPKGNRFVTQVLEEGRADQGILDAFRRIRIGLISRYGLDKHSVILVTSLQSGDAHSFIANNLAQTFWRSREETLLIDANTGVPTAHQAFDVNDDLGLTDVIARNVPLNQVIQTSLVGPHVITGGTQKLAAADLIGSSDTQTIVSELRQQYDYIVISTTQAVTSADAAALSQFVDAVILVMSLDVEHDVAVKVLRELSHRPVALVLRS